MHRRGLADGDLVRVTSRRGSIVLPVSAGEMTGRMQAWIPMHWGGEFLSGRAPDGGSLGGVNELTNSASCPQSRQPELKHCAVKIEKLDQPWSLLAAAWLPQDDALAALASLRSLMGGFAGATCVPFGREPLDATADSPGLLGVLFRAADSRAAPSQTLAGDRKPARAGRTHRAALRRSGAWPAPGDAARAGRKCRCRAASR